MADEEIIRRLDLIASTLRLAFEPQLKAAREKMRADDVTAAILDEAEDWTPSTQIQTRVAKTTRKSARTVRDRLPELVDLGVIEARGTERRMEYRRTGLI